MEEIIFSSEITDIPLTIHRIDTFNYKGSYAKCTVTGATTTNWQAKNFDARVNCKLGDNGRLDLYIGSILGPNFGNRYILIKLPLNNQTGIFQVYPDMPPYFYCGNTYITSRYSLNDYPNDYFATSGTFNIINMDTALKKLNATFNITFKDTSSRQETIQITNGAINLNNWFPY